MRRLVATLLFALMAAPVLAATATKITADTFVVDDAAKVATFSGHVVVDREGMKLNADEVVVHYGAGGTSDIKEFTASGLVRIKTKDQTATGTKATFVPATQVLTLSGDVKVDSSMGTLSGPQLVIDLKNNTSTFSGGSSGRVTGVFNTQ